MMNLLSVFVLAHGEEHFAFHPPLVHFPIAFYFLEFLLLVLWVVKRDTAYHRFALFAFRTGYIFMIFAVIAGFIDAGGVKEILKDEEVREHFLAASAVFIFYTVRAVYWKRALLDSKGYKLFQVLGALLGFGLVAFTAFLGGELG